MLVADWHGTDGATGVRVALPRDWSVLAVEIFDPKRGTIIPESVVWRSVSSVQVESALMRDDCTLLVSFKTGDTITRSRATVTPITREGGQVVEVDGAVVERPASTVRHAGDGATSNSKVGYFEGTDVLRVDRGRLSGFLPSASHSVSLWLKTTKTNQVVMSDWSGSGAARYLFELIITGDGEIAYYRGEPGRHESMASGVAIADGRWHNVSVSYDAESAWTRLLVDGVLADSLYGFVSLGTMGDITIGGRQLWERGDENVLVPARHAAFTGLLDDVAFWSGGTAGEPMFVVNFEDDERGTAGPVQTVLAPRPSRLSTGILQARVVGGSIELTWPADVPSSAAYVIERSHDGRAFQEVGRRYFRDAFDGVLEWSDPHLEESVVYYRLRYRTEAGRWSYTPIIKLGIADLAAPVGAARQAISVRNFPNPFRESTSIQFSLPDGGHTTVSVWDLAGQPVVTLVDATLDGGPHEVAFSAAELSAGTYFVRIRQGTQVASSKLLVVR